MTTLAAGLAMIVEEVWSTVLGLPLARSEGVWVEPNDPAVPMMTCVVPVEGAWNGGVAVTCSPVLANRIAASMLDVSAPDPADVRDALGEVTNIVAGNAKSLLPQPSTILLPVVTSEHGHSFEVLEAPVVARIAFSCDGLGFTVSALGSASELELA